MSLVRERKVSWELGRRALRPSPPYILRPGQHHEGKAWLGQQHATHAWLGHQQEPNTWINHPPESQSSSCLNTLYEYMRNSSMHGLRYIGDLSLNVAERLFWVVAFLLAMTLAIYFICDLFIRYNTMPVIQSISPTTTELQSIPFPAITICNMNNVRKSVALEIENSDSDLEKELLNDICESKDNIRTDENKTESWEVIEKFLKKVTQSCESTLVYCSWHNEVYPCNKIWKPTLTDEGMCCTFNRVAAKFIYRNPKVLDEVDDDSEDILPSVDWTPEKGYPEATPILHLPWRPWGPGTDNGLTIVLDAEIDEYRCSSETSVGFKMLLHNPIETPKIAAFGMLVEPSKETRILIRPNIFVASTNLETITLKKRKCYFPHERSLRFYRTYTQKNCMRECEANFTLDMCKCVEQYMPKGKKTSICGRGDNECVENAQLALKLRTFEESTDINMTDLDIEPQFTVRRTKKSKKLKSKKGCNCLPGCHEIGYTQQQTSGPLSNVLDIKTDYKANKSKEYFLKNMAIVHFYFADSQFTSTQRGALYGLTEFISNTGGLFGLFMGFSILSLVEIIYYMSIRAWCSVSKRMKPKLKPENVLLGNKGKHHFPFVK